MCCNNNFFFWTFTKLLVKLSINKINTKKYELDVSSISIVNIFSHVHNIRLGVSFAIFFCYNLVIRIILCKFIIFFSTLQIVLLNIYFYFLVLNTLCPLKVLMIKLKVLIAHEPYFILIALLGMCYNDRSNQLQQLLIFV